MWYSTSQKVKQLGGAVVDSHKEATHLVMSEAARTIKLLCCLSTCKYILSEAWIRDSHAHNTFLGKIAEFKMVLAKYVAWYAYSLNCCSCQWSYSVLWIFTDLIPPPIIWFHNAGKFSENVFFIGATCPVKHWSGAPIQWELGAVWLGLQLITHMWSWG